VNRWICVEARARREGVYGVCEWCHGEGELWDTPAIKDAYEAWTPTEPPTGEGYQLWETTSEGSPYSPVFETLEALCAWCETHATTFGSQRTTAAEWQRMLAEDCVSYEDGQGNVFL
jgi:hypothetical protein